MSIERPACSGKWISGSGGHRIHESCGKLADWWHPDDCYAYCSEHVAETEKYTYLRWEPSLRDYTWSPFRAGCSLNRGGTRDCDSHNGSWSSPDKKTYFCWKHYQVTLARQAATDSADVQKERQRIAEGLRAWVAMWSKPVRVAFSQETIDSAKMINLSWLQEFAEGIQKGTFGKPHFSEPDPVYLESNQLCKYSDGHGVNCARNALFGDKYGWCQQHREASPLT